MRPEIVAKQVKAMQNAGLDAMISCSPENFAYLTGFVVPSQPLIRHRHAMVIVTADGKTAIFGVDMEATTIKRREPDTPSRIWAEFTDSAMAVPVRTTRVEVRLEARQTLELAWRLWPGAKRVVVLGATVSGYARVNQQLDAQFQEFASVHGLELRRLSGLTMAEYRRQAAAIPPDSLIRTAVPVADPPHRDPPGVRRVAVANPDHRRLAGASGTTDPRRAGFGAGAAGLLAGA